VAKESAVNAQAAMDAARETAAKIAAGRGAPPAGTAGGSSAPAAASGGGQ
jgi:hypothetical protein